LLLQLTSITKEQFLKLEKIHLSEKKDRILQKELIKRLFFVFYGNNQEYEKFSNISKYLFAEQYQSIDEKILLDIFKNIDNFKYDFKEDLFTQLKKHNFISSKREFNQYLKDKAIKIDQKLIIERDFKLNKNDFLKRNIIILSLGKKKKIFIKIN
jgi:tyrosyl-tRNA synthetase